jgi:PII-like signaling protein
VDDDCIRLTSYFRERQRAEGRAIADALTGLYASREVAASIVLRGTEGLSAAIAVSPRPDMEALLSQVVELVGPGLVTVERARLLTGDIDPVWLGEQPGEATMLTVHCGRQDHVYHVPAFEAVCELLYRRGIAGATVLPGTGGTIRGRRQHPRPYRHDDDAPVMVIAVGSGNEIGTVLPELGTLFRHPVMAVQKIQLCERDGQFISRPRALLIDEPTGMAKQLKLTVYTSEAARHDGQPVHRALARQLGPNGLEATTVRGIWGFHAEHAPHGDRFPYRGRHVPAVTTVTGAPEQISAAFDAVGALTADRGLVTVQTVLGVRSAVASVRRPS